MGLGKGVPVIDEYTFMNIVDSHLLRRKPPPHPLVDTMNKFEKTSIFFEEAAVPPFEDLNPMNKSSRSGCHCGSSRMIAGSGGCPYCRRSEQATPKMAEHTKQH
jgi:hypothetical protein